MSTKGSGSSPPNFQDDEKFDGTNYLEWSEKIMMACRVRGARGYLEGKIAQPQIESSPSPSDKPTTTPKPAVPETTWTSLNPSWDEWDARDAWCLMAICQNVKNATGLGLKTDGTAAEAWKSITERYKTSSDLARVYAQRELRNARLNEGDSFPAHMSNLHMKHKSANAVGANIGDMDFREIVLASLPASWDPIISTLNPSESSADTIKRLDMQWSRFTRNAKPATSGTSATALKATTKSSDAYIKKICTNPICNRKGHLIADCYWKGGGKEGQFPAGFGQRGGATGSAAAAVTPSTPIANTAVIEKAYALMAHVPLREITPESPVSNPSDLPTLIEDGSFIHPEDIKSLIATMIAESTPDIPCAYPPDKLPDGFDEIMEYVVSNIPTKEEKDRFIEMAMMAGINVDELATITYADSGASNHCFANKSDFSTYERFSEMQEGQAASKSAQFKIHGKGTVVKTYESDHKRALMTFTEALHTPDFAANLISISRFDAAGFNVNFGGGRARFIDPDGNEALSVKGANGMYVFQDAPAIVAMPAKSHEKATHIDNWHRRFAHFGVR